MIRCQRCGNELPNTVSICPRCGSAVSAYDGPPQSFTQYTPQSGQAVSGYGPAGYPFPPEGYGGNLYRPGGVNVTVVNTMPPQKSSGPLIAEILLAFFLGLFGVGWLASGETAVGLVLLLGSIFIIWPGVVLFAVFTFGIGLCIIWPLIIVGIIVDGILLNRKLDEKARSQTMIMRAQSW
jgi:hypothetical protein